LTALLKDLIPEGQLPVYQDLSFKLNLPAGKAGIFSLWAIGALDRNSSEPLEDSTDRVSNWDRSRYTWEGTIAMCGLTHKIILSENTSVKTSLTSAMNRFNEQDSKQQQRVVYDLTHAWESRFPNTFFIDFTMTFRINKPRYASVWGVQIKNLLLEKSIYDHEFNTETQTEEYKLQDRVLTTKYNNFRTSTYTKPHRSYFFLYWEDHFFAVRISYE
jgi:hypothetical protein